MTLSSTWSARDALCRSLVYVVAPARGYLVARLQGSRASSAGRGLETKGRGDWQGITDYVRISCCNFQTHWGTGVPR